MGLHANASSTGRLLELIRKGDAARPALRQEPGQSGPGKWNIPLLRPLKERRVLGVEWRGRCLYLAESRHGRTGLPVLQGVQAIRIPAGIRPGDDAFSSFLRQQVLDFCGPAPDLEVWAALPDEHAEHWHFRIPKVSAKERDDVAFWTARKEREFDERQSVFDCTIGGEIIEKGVPKLPVTATLAVRAALGEVRNIVQRAGFALAGAATRVIASHNLFTTGWLDPATEQFAVLHIDEESTRIDIYSSSQVVLSRMVKTGFASLARALVESTAGTAAPLSDDDARTLLLRDSTCLLPVHDRQEARGQGTTGQPVPVPAASPETAQPAARPAPDIGTSIAPAVERLVRQFERTMDHFSNTLGYPAVSRMFLSTPGGCLQPLVDEFGRQVGIPCTALSSQRGPATPGAELDIAKLPPDCAEAQWAVGLSLSSDDRTQNCVNTFRERKQARQRERLRLAVAVGSMVVVLCTSVFASIQGAALLSARSERDGLRQQLTAFGETTDKARLLATSAKGKALRLAVQSMSRRQMPVALLSELAAVTPSGVRLSGLRLTQLDHGQIPGARDAKARSSQPQGKADAAADATAMAVVTGVVAGDMLQREAMLADFLYRLERSPMVLSVTVEKKSPETGAATESLQFIATLKLV
ncbi:hypothetical protein FVW20_04045 [Desulfovibrio oxamicus]|uniref:Uncharacterized protein n=1 Tax=Nitratidesulfovibrio oxamicus TaxID=32016 RepID=A0ABS0J1C7_9BACT|nr:hypothetical protein [Nitratidesulfovibrio oxamicus]MBG3876221.1 hypothetical protein [Nitratidesulfovibrio oxamicus]